MITSFLGSMITAVLFHPRLSKLVSNTRATIRVMTKGARYSSYVLTRTLGETAEIVALDVFYALLCIDLACLSELSLSQWLLQKAHSVGRAFSTSFESKMMLLLDNTICTCSLVQCPCWGCSALKTGFYAKEVPGSEVLQEAQPCAGYPMKISKMCWVLPFQ